MAETTKPTTTDKLRRTLPPGKISAWPDSGDWDDPDDDWVVGVAKSIRTGEPVIVKRGDSVGYWNEIATVANKRIAVALAAHLNEVQRGR
jgi:hypothetical protein